MLLGEFRSEMEAYRRSASDNAKSLKDSQVVLETLKDLYRSFDATGRLVADQVLSEWVLSRDEGFRFDALALIADYRINSTIPALRGLIAHLASSTEPSAPFERKKVQRILSDLGDLEVQDE